VSGKDPTSFKSKPTQGAKSKEDLGLGETVRIALP
jgi:hypothetical protein